MSCSSHAMLRCSNRSWGQSALALAVLLVTRPAAARIADRCTPDQGCSDPRWRGHAREPGSR